MFGRASGAVRRAAWIGGSSSLVLGRWSLAKDERAPKASLIGQILRRTNECKTRPVLVNWPCTFPVTAVVVGFAGCRLMA
jgi:hypothetical protein